MKSVSLTVDGQILVTDGTTGENPLHFAILMTDPISSIRGRFEVGRQSKFVHGIGILFQLRTSIGSTPKFGIGFPRTHTSSVNVKPEAAPILHH